MSSNAKESPGKADYQEHSMWKYDDESDLYYPVISPKDLPEAESDLSIYTKFTLPNGKNVEGYTVGVERVFSMGLFGDNNIFFINKNMPDLSTEQIQMFLVEQPLLEIEKASDIFPLKYRTLINADGFSDVTGTFDMGETFVLTDK